MHAALDTRLYYRFCKSLAAYYDVTLIAVHPMEEVRDGIRIVPFRRYRNKMVRVLFTWLVMYIKALKVKAVLYHIHDPELIPCGLLLKWSGKKVILDIHENVAEDIFDKPWIPYKKLLYSCFHFFEKLAVRHLHIFLAEHSYESRYRSLGAHYTVVLNYHDAAFFRSYHVRDRSQNSRIFYIGILLHSRGITEIAKAIFLLKKRGIIVHFDIVGELYTGLDHEIDSLEFIDEIKNQLHFHGRLSLEKGYEISTQAAVGMCIIHPMKNSTGSYPTKMFEYMAVGLPQIISDFPLYRSVVERHHCGICVNPLDPEAIAAALERLLGNPQLRNEMGAAGQTASAAYTWETQFAAALEVYRSLLKTQVPVG